MRRLVILVFVLALAAWLPMSAAGRGVDGLTAAKTAQDGAGCSRTSPPAQDHVLAPPAAVTAGSSQARPASGGAVSLFSSPAIRSTQSSLVSSGTPRLYDGRPPLVFPLLI